MTVLQPLDTHVDVCPRASLIFDRVTFSYQGKHLLGPCSFTLQGAGPTLVMGPNGAGKSLLLRLAHGLLTPASGRVHWLPQRPRQAMVFQQPVMLRRSAIANLMHALAVNKTSRRQRREMAHAALARFGLAASAETPARVLSGGEQQRLALARAWVLAPQVLFLDEPTSALDPAAIKAVEEAVLAFQRQGTRVVMTTHDIHQARRLATDVLFMAGGQVREHTSAQRFFDQPDSSNARAYLRGEIIE
mgnify:CR=1 FL=1